MTSPLRPADYEKLYEDGLLKLNQAVEALTTLASKEEEKDGEQDDDDAAATTRSRPPPPTRDLQHASARVLVARANMDGILQQQSTSKMSSHKVRESAAAFLHQRRVQQAQAQPVRQIEQSILQRSLRIPTTSTRSKKMSNENLSSIFHATADDFFEAYPEAMRNKEEDGSDDESSSSSGEEEDQAACKPKMKKKSHQTVVDENEVEILEQQPLAAPTRPAANPYARNNAQGQPEITSATATSANHPPRATIDYHSSGSRPSSSSSHRSNPGFQYTPVDLTNDTQGDARPNLNEQRYPPPPPPQQQPYHHQHQHQHQQQPPPQRNPYQNRRSQPSPQDHSSWDDHQRLNPFQTAREFSSAGGNDRGQSRHSQQQPQQPPPPQQDIDRHYDHQRSYDSNPPTTQVYPDRNNNHDQNTTTRSINNPYNRPPSPPPEAPGIRNSLKRKFQPPIKRSASEQHPQHGSQKQEKKGSSKSTNDKASEGEEDELPEELKRFGKDLVEKIINEIVDAGDPITFDDIAGLDDAKQTIQEVICWPMKRPDLFTGLRKAPNGLLLYGPPGTGKTLIGKAIAHESGATFFSISSSSLTSKWIGEGEKLVRTMFAVAAYREPSVVFIDEIDSLLTQRKSDDNEASRRIKTEFLVQLDGTGTTAQGRVLTIGATNRPQELDEAARRRFVKRLYIPLPVESDRQTLLEVLLTKNNHRLTPVEVGKLARETTGFSGADLKSLCADAAMGPIRQLGPKALQVDANDVPPISYKHFRQSLRSMKPSVAAEDLVQYIEWDKIYGSKRVEDGMDTDGSEEEEA